MEKCKKIGIHLTESEYYGATDDSRGVTDIYCNIESPKRIVLKVKASVIGFDDKVEACLKCSNLDEDIKKDLLCKSPYKNDNIVNKSNYCTIGLSCNYLRYISSNKEETENATLFCRKKDSHRATYQQLLFDVCDKCFLNPKKYEK